MIIPPFEKRMFFRFISTREAGVWSAPLLVSGEILSRNEIDSGWHMVDDRTADIFIPGKNGGRKVSVPPAIPEPPKGNLPERKNKLKQNAFISNNIYLKLLPEDLR